MGNFNTPGIIKFWWKNDIVETKYNTIHQIPVITIDKQQFTIPDSSTIIAIVHFDDSKKYAQICSKLGSSLKIYGIPNQDSKQSFEQIKRNNKESLGKMVMNGPRTHPLFKFLKRNCNQFYSYNTKSSKMEISKSMGMFWIERNNLNKPTKITYCNEKQINDFIKELQKSATQRQAIQKMLQQAENSGSYY